MKDLILVVSGIVAIAVLSFTTAALPVIILARAIAQALVSF